MSEPATNQPSGTWTSRDTINLYLVSVLALLYTMPWLGGLEFFRHTEADRTLIGWSIAKSNDWLVPTLLGDSYLTKPPLYYWLLAVVFHVVNGPFEWAARVVSAVSFCLLLTVHYISLREVGFRREESLLGTAILGTAAGFFFPSISAEIDMTFTLAVSVCLVLCYFGFVAKRGESYAYSSYIWLAIAFLIKGPPVLVFFGTGALYWLWRSKWPRESLTLHFRGMLLALAILGPWFFALWGRVGLEEIARVLRVEVIDRFLGDPRAGEQSRGAFFYAISIFSGLLPWSAIFLAWLPTLRRPRSSDFSYVAPDLFRFVLAVSIPSIIFFSFSSGKSARYLLPLFPLLSVFILECAREIWISGGEKMLRFTSQILGLSLIGASIAAPLLQPGALNSVNSDRLLLSLLPCGIFGGIFAFASHRERQYGPWIFALVLLFISIRIPFYFLYVPLRNETNTVKPLVHEIEAVLPPGHPLYTLEMFERWVNYYAARDGIPSYRLTPRLVTELKSRSPGERIYVLLNEANESWRLIQLAPIMQEVKTEALLKHGRHPLRLISIPAREAYRFDPTQDFPTSYSKPEITEPVTITLPDRVV